MRRRNGNQWTVKRIGKRLDRIWPHLQARDHARKEKGHANLWMYQFRHNG